MTRNKMTPNLIPQPQRPLQINNAPNPQRRAQPHRLRTQISAKTVTLNPPVPVALNLPPPHLRRRQTRPVHRHAIPGPHSQSPPRRTRNPQPRPVAAPFKRGDASGRAHNPAEQIKPPCQSPRYASPPRGRRKENDATCPHDSATPAASAPSPPRPRGCPSAPPRQQTPKYFTPIAHASSANARIS